MQLTVLIEWSTEQMSLYLYTKKFTNVYNIVPISMLDVIGFDLLSDSTKYLIAFNKTIN